MGWCRCSRGLEVAAEVARGDKGGGDDLGVGHGALSVFAVAERFEKVVGEAVDCDGGGVHGSGVGEA